MGPGEPWRDRGLLRAGLRDLLGVELHASGQRRRRPWRRRLADRLARLAGPAIAAVVVTAWISGRAGLADLARRIVHWRFARAGGRPRSARSPSSASLSASRRSSAIFPRPAISVAKRMAADRHRRRSARRSARRVCGRDRLARLRATCLPAPCQRGASRANRGGVLGALAPALLFPGVQLPRLRTVHAVGFTIGIVSGSVVLTWVYYGAGQSILAVTVWHAAYDMATSGTSGTIQAIVSALPKGRIPWTSSTFIHRREDVHPASTRASL